MQLCCIPLRDLRYLRENIHARRLNLYCTNEPQVFSRRSRRFTQTKPQNNKTTLTSPNCLSLRDNAACCIRLCVICVICGRIYIQTYSINPHRRNPNVSRRSRRFTQTNHKTTEPHKNSPPTQSVFLCVIMQPAAFLCVICVICGRIHTQEYSIYPHRRNPNVSRRSR